MKTIILALAFPAAAFLFFACKQTRYAADNLPDRQLRWGSGGGYVGKETTYTLLDNGQIFIRETGSKLAETSAANLVFRFGNAWVTPPTADGALPGTARARLLDASLIAERRITAAELVQAEAGFAVSALTLRPIAAIDSRNLAVPGTEAFVAFSDVLEM